MTYPECKLIQCEQRTPEPQNEQTATEEQDEIPY